MILFKRSKEGPWPVAVECPRPSYPNLDIDGDTIYANSHFRSEAKCWDNIRANVEATVSICGGRVTERKKDLREAEKEAATAAEAFAAYRRAFDDWELERRRKAEAAGEP